MSKNPTSVINALRERENSGLLRKLPSVYSGVDFLSNDYLGYSRLGLIHSVFAELFAEHNFSSGSGGSRLISGNSEFKIEAEKKIAHFHSAESALLFNSGYDANVGIMSCIPKKNDLVLSDELIHASLYDGIRLSYAKHFKFKHNNTHHLEELLERHHHSYENIYVVLESVYSMDGDEAPLTKIVETLNHYNNAYLVVDEAHAIGVLGEQGRGLCNESGVEEKCFARIYTYGKAMGCHGAAVVGNTVLIDYLVNYARSFIYTTALPDHSVAKILCAYTLLEQQSQQESLHLNIKLFLEATKNQTDWIKSRSAIQFFLTGERSKAIKLEKLLLQKGYHVKAIQTPTVKEGTERIRICLHSFNSVDEINGMLGFI